jgi:4-amino-4-deoxy-L-arabinose transferase-like glycosyltransferase
MAARGADEVTDSPPARSVDRFCARHFATLAVGVLAIAAFNLTFRLGREVVTEWDESLYANSASEIVQSGNWLAVTFFGELDYYNSKPPLNVWLIALAFKTFGTNLWSLRLASAGCAWLTVLVLTAWGRRCFGAAVGLASGVVLATSFGFLYVHSGRSANTDAIFTLLVLLTVVAVWAADTRPWHVVWLGPIFAAVFLLRGMGVLMPLILVVAARLWRGRQRATNWASLAVAAGLFVAPVAAWSIARWQLDGSRFFRLLFGYDFVARSVRAIEGHEGGWFYYAAILAKHHYEWLAAGAIALLLFPIPWRRFRTLVLGGSSVRHIVVIAWVGATIVIPTLMRTKLPWYLNSFYPVFALGTGWLVTHGLSVSEGGTRLRRRRAVLVGVVAAMLSMAEAKLLWYSYHYRDLRRSTQGLLLSERRRLHGRRVFCSRRNRGEAFVLGGVIKTDRRFAENVDAFIQQSRSGDYWLSEQGQVNSDLTLVSTNGQHWLYQRR